MSIKGHRDQIERDFWRETFGERPLERDLIEIRLEEDFWRETFGERPLERKTKRL